MYWVVIIYTYFNCVLICFANLYPGLSFQLAIGQTEFCSLCSFMVPCICGAFGFMLLYFHLLFLLIITVADATPYVSLLFICDVC
jgi:hypothetical protein